MIRAALLGCALCMASLPVLAATCNEQATEKKLAGAAKSSFIGKCEKDARATCENTAAEKKLNGAAKTSFMGKCVRDAVGATQ